MTEMLGNAVVMGSVYVHVIDDDTVGAYLK
jgi:hypothetical protein